MRVTSVSVTLNKKASKIRGGYATVVLDDSLVINNIKLIERDSGGFFVLMPSTKRPDGTFVDIVHPINPETREMIEHSVIHEYHRLLGF
jgi:stage V sporulation protein G